jgi:hypothetical protein
MVSTHIPGAAVIRPRHFSDGSVWLLFGVMQFNRFSISTYRRLTLSHAFFVLGGVFIRLLTTTLGLSRTIFTEDVCEGFDHNGSAMNGYYSAYTGSNNAHCWNYYAGACAGCGGRHNGLTGTSIHTRDSANDFCASLHD